MSRLLRAKAVAISTALTLVLGLAPAGVMAAVPALNARVVQSGLNYPWDIAFTPDGQMIVTERPGRIRVFASGGPSAALLATNKVANVRAHGEAGLMGIAVDPNFQTNRRIYVCASRQVGAKWLNQVIRYRLNASWRTEQARVVIKYAGKANTIHNGCAVEIGPDGKLWVSMGDAGVAMRAQDPTNRNGKVMRATRGGGTPADNPLMPGASKRTIIYSMGHRNPQGIAFEPGSGRVYAIEHGPDRADEVNWIRKAAGNVGRNYGWPCRTGFGDLYQPCGGGAGPFTDPAFATGNFTIAMSGGTFVQGSRWGDFQAHLFVAQLKERDLRRFTVSGSGLTVTHRATYYDGRWGRLRATVLGNHGHLWLSTSNGTNDRIIRIVASSS